MQIDSSTPGNGHTGVYVFLLTLVAALGGLLFGYDTAVISGAIGFMKEHFQLDSHSEGWAASCALVGCIFGASVAGILSDWRGRRWVLFLSAILFTVSAVGAAIPSNLTQFAVARFLGGFGIGAASMLSPLYIAEVAPAHIRGRLVSINQFAIILGMLVVYLANSAIARQGVWIGGEEWNVVYGWRWMFASGVLPAVVFLGLLFLVPESPRWLVKMGRQEEALSILTRIGGPSHAEAELASIQETVHHKSLPLGQLFHPELRPVLLAGVVLAVLQQITGINVVLYYAPEIFKSAGLKATQAIDQTIAVGVVNLAFTLVAIWLVDHVGRKPLLLIASAGMGLSLAFLGRAFVIEAFEGPVVLLSVLCYVASFAIAMGPVVWVVLAEVFPTAIRGTAMSIATVCLWISCFLVSQFFPWMLENLGGKSFFVYAAVCAVAFVFIYVFIPETKGRSLEEIEKDWFKRDLHRPHDLG